MRRKGGGACRRGKERAGLEGSADLLSNHLDLVTLRSSSIKSSWPFMYHGDPLWNELISLDLLYFSSIDLSGNTLWLSSIDKKKNTHKKRNHDKQEFLKKKKKHQKAFKERYGVCHMRWLKVAHIPSKKGSTRGTDTTLKVRTVRWAFHHAVSAAGYSVCSCEGFDL